MIEYCNGVFHIAAGNMSYMFRVTKHGQLEHVHFGQSVQTSDVPALAVKPGTGWGTSVVSHEDDNAACQDIMPLEWSGAGRGDYRESPVELEGENGPVSTDFIYESHKIIDGGAAMESGLPQAKRAQQTLAVTLADRALNARITLYYALHGTVLTRRTVLENTGSRPLYIRKLMSFCLDLAGEYNMTTLDGGWNAEAHVHTAPVGPSRIVSESVTGFSSNRHNPGFMLSEKTADEDRGRVYGINLIYSGNHYASAQRSLQGLTRVMQGISPNSFRYELAPGQTFESPEAVLCFSPDGFNGMSRLMHGFVNSCIVPEYWQYRARPVLFNDWEGCMFDFTHKRLIDLARRAKRLGCELFVLDDGWFGERNSDTAGLGDYNVNMKKLPRGLDGLSKKIKAMGMGFGLWFEPEAVNPDSGLFRAHPDWVLRDGREPLMSRHQLLLDLTRPEVRDYIVSSVTGILDSAEISYVKWDMNRHSPALGAKAHEYILGLYEVLHRIFDKRPEILLESCSSGGNRFDLGMLCFSPQIWSSDDTDPIERLDIQSGLSYLYPQSAMGAHVSAAPHCQTLRDTPLSTRANVSFFGCLGYELDLKHLLPIEEREIKKQISFYKAHRETFQFGAFSRLSAPGDGAAWQVSGEREHIAAVFRRLFHACPEYETLKIKNLAPDKKYTVKSRKQSLRIRAFGGLINYISPLRIDPNGALFRTADSLAAMPEGCEEYSASGAALTSGISLSSLFTGTGYDKSLRLQGDFGSNMYVIEEAAGHD